MGNGFIVEEGQRPQQDTDHHSCLHNTGSRRVPTPRVQETRALQRYKFILAVENSVCPDYITEKVRRPARWRP